MRKQRGLFIYRLWSGGWVAVGRRLPFIEPYRPHVVKIATGATAVKGKTPFEALYRYRRYEAESRKQP